MAPSRTSILIVDDEQETLGSFMRTLQSAGYRVVAMSHGNAAVEHAMAAPPDLVLSDVSMPGLNGFQLCRTLKHTDGTRDIPILLMSTRTEPADHYWAEEVGAEALLPKTLQASSLLAKVASMLHRN